MNRPCDARLCDQLSEGEHVRAGVCEQRREAWATSVHVVGLSMGGMVALELALAQERAIALPCPPMQRPADRAAAQPPARSETYRGVAGITREQTVVRGPRSRSCESLEPDANIYLGRRSRSRTAAEWPRSAVLVARRFSALRDAARATSAKLLGVFANLHAVDSVRAREICLAHSKSGVGRVRRTFGNRPRSRISLGPLRPRNPLPF
jgi:hypothetical protein